jgi:hypothetical protein
LIRDLRLHREKNNVRVKIARHTLNVRQNGERAVLSAKRDGIAAGRLNNNGIHRI